MNENVTHGPELTEFMHLNSEALTAKAKRSPIPLQESKGNLQIDFFVVAITSGIASGRVGTTTTESRKMAAVLQLTSMLCSIDTCQNKVSADHVTT